MTTYKYNKATGVLSGKVQSMALLAKGGKYVEKANRMVETSVTFPQDAQGVILANYGGGDVDTYPADDYDTYTARHSTMFNKLRRTVTGGRTKYGDKQEHNDGLTTHQRDLLIKAHHEAALRWHHATLGSEELATHDGITTLRPGGRAFDFVY